MRTVLVLAPNIAPYPGGAEIYISNLMDEIKERDWNVICVTENPLMIEDSRITYIKLTADINRIMSSNTVTWREMIFSLLDKLTELNQRKIDIIHANSMEACIIGKMIAAHRNIPIIATIHEHKLESKSFGWGRVNLVYHCLGLDGIIAPSSYYYNRTKQYGYNTKKIYKIMHGIDIKPLLNFESKEDLRYDGKLNILFVGRVYETKGLHVLIEALGKAGSTLEFHLNVVGPITDIAYKEIVDTMIGTYGLTHCVSFIGPVHPDMVREYMSSADLMIAPSLDEGFGLSIVEAAIMQVPIIASKVGGIVDIIDDMENGLLYEAGNSDTLLGCIHYYTDHPEAVSQWKKHAYQKSTTLFARERMAEETLEVYRKVIEEYEKEDKRLCN